jgi:hypothetical protein
LYSSYCEILMWNSSRWLMLLLQQKKGHVSKLWPLVLPVKVGRWALKKVGWEVDCWECAAEGRNGMTGLGLTFEGQHHGAV